MITLKEFKEQFKNNYYSFDVIDLDNEHVDNLDDKAVVKFQEALSNVVLTSYPPQNPTVLRIYVSRFTEEERKERERQKTIKDTITKLEALTNKRVSLEDYIDDKTE